MYCLRARRDAAAFDHSQEKPHVGQVESYAASFGLAEASHWKCQIVSGTRRR